MAKLALGALGAGVGSVFGGHVGAQWGFSVGVLLGGALFPPKQKPQERGKLDDLRVSGSQYGAMIPQVYGCCRVAGNVIWAQRLQEHVSTKKVGGKGVPKQTAKQYTYTVKFAAVLCEGPIGNVERLWLDQNLVYDRIGKSGTVIPLPDYLDIFLGTETQTASSVIEAVDGVGNVPAYRGLCYLVFEDLELSPWGNRMPNVSAEVCPV